MKKLELILAGIAVLALIIKLLHIPYGAIILLEAFVTLAVYYGCKPIYCEKGKNILNVCNGFALALTIIGSLFYIQHWSFGHKELIVGLLSLIIVSFFYLKNMKQNITPIIRNKIFIIIGILILLFWK